ncbi:arabinofuranosidase [Vararia minispora EC-137]|uniref:Arabinofuranosidase n=1 Tax=Vararia minispora EC-137 TaxID=1314806 RepID=A0ACB8QZA6_9AGAM|nr:arabinofuranosidase [Vararia minispora EC-137]
MVSSVLLALLAAASAPLLSSAQTQITVNGTSSHPIPSTLWGLMFEDISHSGDGGLYGELLQNRAFQQVTPGTTAALNAWSAVGNTTLSVIADSPAISSSLPNALSVTFPSGAPRSGVQNSGYFGIAVRASSTYTASFFYRFPSTLPSAALTATVSLAGASSGTTFASGTVALRPTAQWTQATVALRPRTSAPDINNVFEVTLAAGAFVGTVHLGMFSLFPPTFGGQANGMRADIAQALLDLKPSFFRLPGGNNLEGQTIAQRWQWNNTVGPLTARPGRVGDWGYVNTDGLGLYEYLVWIELMGMVPIMAIWSGFALGGAAVPANQLAPYIEQSRQQIEFVIGSTSTPGGALRASLGHPAPFPLLYVEVGNEDFLQPSTYQSYRWAAFVNALQADYPNLRFLATSSFNSPALSPKPQSWDIHVYQTPTWFTQNSAFYDSFARDGTTFFEGEYAAISTNPNDIFGAPSSGRLVYPTVQSAVSEAAFMMGFERNADVVFAASYAPLLAHVTQNQWTPNLLSFDSGTVIKSTSYWAQWMFSNNRGDVYLPSTLASTSGALFWSVVQRVSPPAFIIKVSNTGTSASTGVFRLPSAVASTGQLIQLAGAANASNTPTTPSAITPQSRTIATGQNLSFSAPAMSLSVITVALV